MEAIKNNTEYKKLSLIESDLTNINELVEFDDYSIGFTTDFANELNNHIEAIFNLRLNYDKKRIK